MDLNGNFLVTGVATDKSLAWAITQQIVAFGGTVILAVHPKFEKIGKMLAERKNIDRVYAADVMDATAMNSMFADLVESGIRLHGLVHSIGFTDTGELEKPYSEASAKNFADTMLISVWSLLDLCRRSKPLLESASSIITLSYGASQNVQEGYDLMGTAKAALENAVRNLAAEFGAGGHRVNALSPSPARTLSAMAVPGYLGIGCNAELKSLLGGRASHLEIGNAAAFLLSRLSGGITGQTVLVDRGASAAGMPLRRNLDRPAPRGEGKLGEFFLEEMRKPPKT